MSDIGIFLVGLLVTLIWGSMVSALLYAALTSNRRTRPDSDGTVGDSNKSLSSNEKYRNEKYQAVGNLD